MAPVMINIVAAQSDTGKTMVIEKLLPELKIQGAAGRRPEGKPASSRSRSVWKRQLAFCPGRR